MLSAFQTYGEEDALAEIRRLLGWDVPGNEDDLMNCACELDEQGCVHYRLTVFGRYSQHEGQECEVKIGVVPIDSA